ncbi:MULTISPECIES: hypothetical protein [unclassified Micromonospora]
MTMNATTSHRAHRGMVGIVLAGCADGDDAGCSSPASAAPTATPSSEPLA